MFAIFETGGKQYKVQVNDVIYVEKLPVNEDKKQVVFTNVLMVDNNIGKPFLSNAKVVCEFQKEVKQKKITIIKHLPQKHHNRKQGHRQVLTKLLVKEIKLA